MKQPTDANIVAMRRPRTSAPSHHRRPRKLKVPTTTPLAAATDPPVELSEAAREEWVRVLPGLLLLGVDPMLDRALICAYAGAVADLAAARAEWTALGTPLTVTRPAGEREHPLVQIIRQFAADAAKWGAALGLSPRGRRALGVEIVSTAATGDGSPYYDD